MKVGRETFSHAAWRLQENPKKKKTRFKNKRGRS
jgi:hypothetical protein